MEALKKETVHMKDRDHVEKILKELINGGPSKLQVVSDFDKTLTRAHKDGVICDSTYGSLEGRNSPKNVDGSRNSIDEPEIFLENLEKSENFISS